MKTKSVLLQVATFFIAFCSSHGFVTSYKRCHGRIRNQISMSIDVNEEQTKKTSDDRRAFLSKATAVAFSTLASIPIGGQVQSAEAVGPVKITLVNPIYSAKICPKDRPIPGEKAMKGMKGLCVTVKADLKERSPKDLEKVGVYGFVTDYDTGDSVLANNPDLSTDAGQFAMIETITPQTDSIEFEFIAAIPMEKDISQEENGIGKLNFDSLRVISFPGGQQYGAINPCEMDEFSMECEDWEAENGTYKKGNYMMESNARTKGR